MELIEVRARTVELAKQAALEELGLKDQQRVEWEILQEPNRGFLGMGRQDAIVRAKRRPAKRRRTRSGRGPRKAQSTQTRGPSKTGKKPNSGRPSVPKAPATRPAKGAGRGKTPQKKAETALQEQTRATEEFLSGLLEAIAVPGKVKTRSEENLIVAEVEGEETEVLVGQRGSGIEALHTISKSVIKRKTLGGARLRLDIAGYGRRRREALAIYATGLVEQVTDEGGELMLEPMSAADRKVIHDTVAKHQDVRSFSEGEAPYRYVVIAYSS